MLKAKFSTACEYYNLKLCNSKVGGGRGISFLQVFTTLFTIKVCGFFFVGGGSVKNNGGF